MEQQNQPPQQRGTGNTFTHGMRKDPGLSYTGDGYWLHARNAVNNAHEGQTGYLGNEPANFSCLTYPLKYLIGSVQTEGDEWVLFFTDDINSEIGRFNAATCSYTKIVNDPCLKFSSRHLITAVARRTFNCSYNIYWDDGLNPSRVLDINNVPWVMIATTVGGCTTYTPTTQLDCEQLCLAPHLVIPCLSLNTSQGSGTLPNGSYQVAIAYAVNSIKVTDYLVVSNIQSTFNHNNLAGAVRLTLSWPNNTVDPHFEEMEVVVISMVNGQATAKRLGIYDIRESTIYIDNINPSLPEVSLDLIPLQTPPIEKSDAMYKLGDHLVRVGIYTKPDFNYQPQANKITTKWVLAEYADTYYHKGGNNAGYLRDENYIFFIRWIYNTGEKSASYVIPGRAFMASDSGWAGRNTAQITSLAGYGLGDGGTVIAEGLMGYAESTEKYPADKPAIWGALCGQPVRLHKFPDQTVNPILTHFTPNHTIRVLGVRFDNITHPLDINGNPIPDIVGYELLRGSREGNKTVIAKGLLNNMRVYDIPGGGGQGLFQNYPYNDLRPDYYLTSDQSIVNTGTAGNNRNSPLTAYRRDIFSFHSPDTNFRHPFLGGNSFLKIYHEHAGTSVGRFKVPYKHPKFKVLTNFDSIVADIIGLLSIINSIASIVSGYDLKLTGSEEIPMEFPLGMNPNYPGDITGAATANTSPLTDITYFTSIAYNAVLVILMAPYQIKIVQQQILNVFNGLIPAQQFAAQYNSHGFFNTPVFRGQNIGAPISDYQYIKQHLQTFAGFDINNLFRNDYVALQVAGQLPDPQFQDTSRFTLSDNGNNFSGDTVNPIASLYGGIKIPIPSQYGQIGAVKQVPVSGCTYPTKPDFSAYSSPVVFGGDTYINRYTEKNPFLFFNDWLMGQEDDYHYDYRNHMNVPFPRYWIDNRKLYYDFLALAERYRHLDQRVSSMFYVKQGYFYTSCNGVRDFYVESEVNVGYRDWEDEISKRFYDPYGFTNVDYIFRSDYISSPVYFKYDYSLSAGYFYNQYISWGQCLDRDFDPLLAVTCFDYYPRRLMYSLPQSEELKKDNWRQFLVNNYKDFNDIVTAVKEVGKTGALFLFANDSPGMLMGLDALQTAGGTNITIGDGGLFAQPLQSLANADAALHHAACQNRLSALSTPYGLFWVSQDSGKIFHYSGGLADITKDGLKWWMAQYLPSKLLLQFPGYELKDNPVRGIGVQVSYDAVNEVLYISKKDYEAIDPANTGFISTTGEFYYNPIAPKISIKVSLNDKKYFRDSSWTVSYDLKTKSFVSFHDWHPDYTLSTKRHVMTSKNGQLWRHNERCDLFCNFYGTNYPFELEWAFNTGKQVTTLRNIEYYLQSFYYQNNCWDKFQPLDENFDQAIISNEEQMSGLLRLHPKPWNNPWAVNNYPAVTLTGIDVLYAKKEQQYRFNQFWDVTKDRGMFSGAAIHMFLTDPNGYTFSVNPAYVDYNKPQLQRKKFRNILNRIMLRRTVSGKTKMIMRFSETKNQVSPR